jgi:ABC-type glycerol-3-phosphate transport system permease component
MSARAAQPPWMERPSAAHVTAKVIVFALVLIAVLYPLLSVLATSLASQSDVDAGGGMVLFPAHPSLDAYFTIFQGGVITRAALVSVGITIVGTVLSLVITTGLAYGLSRPVVGRKPLLLLALFSLLFQPGIIPSYLVVKELGLLNSYAALILPVVLNGFNLVVMRQFFMEIPHELIDSARIDGANELRILLSIVLPLSGAILAVIALLYAVFYWNAFFQALLYLSDNSMWPLQLVLRQYVIQGSPLPGVTAYSAAGGAPPPTQSIQMAVVIVATLPILVVFPFLQKYFTRGVLTGAIKG